jgi:murein DD-endopeptidase MepM/ murein hydrolase activator NlpD
MKKTISLLLFLFYGCILSLYTGVASSAGLLPGGYDVTKLPKPLPYTYNGVTYNHVIASPHTDSDDHWVAYYNTALTQNGDLLILTENDACFYQTSQNGPTSGNPNAWCGAVSIIYNQCAKTYYSDVDIRADSSGILYTSGGNCNSISYSTNDLLIQGVPYDVTTSLKWPLTGTFASRTVTLPFGASWVRDCPSGIPKRHGGTDVNATLDEAVYAAHDGVVKAVHDATTDGWAYAIVIEDTSSLFTTVYWHISTYDGLSVNDTVVRGQQIATVANLGSNTHFHFGIRNGAYNASLSLAGSLPVASCNSYPAYPENLKNPATIPYQ